MGMPAGIRVDWPANTGGASIIVVTVWRFGQYARGRFLLHLAYRCADFLLLRLLIGIDLPDRLSCGPGLQLHHGGRGVSINRHSVLGDRVEIYQLASIGNRNAFGCPTIGNDVVIGAGARLLGPIKVGDGARIGANAVVVRDVPAGAVVVAPPGVLLSDLNRGPDPASD